MRIRKTVALLLLGLCASPLFSLPATIGWLEGILADYWAAPRLVSLGWSDGGKWAALVPQDSGLRGGQGAHLLIFDTVEDQILFESELWDEEFGEPMQLAASMARTSDARAFLARLSQLQIQPEPAGSNVLQRFPALIRTQTYAAELSTVRQSDERLDFRLTVTSPQGKKVIASGSLDAKSASLEGLFVHPRRPRSVVIWHSMSVGGEGDTFTSVRFSGCKLDSGFTKR